MHWYSTRPTHKHTSAKSRLRESRSCSINFWGEGSCQSRVSFPASPSTFCSSSNFVSSLFSSPLFFCNFKHKPKCASSLLPTPEPIFWKARPPGVGCRDLGPRMRMKRGCSRGTQTLSPVSQRYVRDAQGETGMDATPKDPSLSKSAEREKRSIFVSFFSSVFSCSRSRTRSSASPHLRTTNTMCLRNQ